MIDPSEHTVAAVKDWVRENDPAVRVLQDIEAAERAGKDRVTLTRWLDDQYDDADTDAAVVDLSTGADPEARGQKARRPRGPRPGDADTPDRDDDAYDPREHPYWRPNEVPNSPEVEIPTVAVSPPGEGGYAGYWFEDGRARAVRRTRRVDRAIVDGPLEYISAAPNREDGEYL